MPKLILWSAPRCLSTAFEYAIRRLEQVDVSHECYTDTVYFGMDRWLSRYPHLQSDPQYSYNAIKQRLEAYS